MPAKKNTIDSENSADLSGPLLSKPLKELAEEPDSSSYASLPVSEFGAAMLQSMSASSSKTSKKHSESKPIQYVPRPLGLGLGASQVTDLSKLKQRKPVELALGLELDSDERRAFKSKAPANEMLSSHANYVGIDERAPKRIRMVIEEGSRVLVVAGKHKGLKGKILKASSGGSAWMIELEVNREIVLVDKKDVQLALPGAKAESKQSKQSSEPAERSPIDQSWLYPGLKVRIVSKNSFERGKYYNVKGIILDVHGHAECSLRLLSSASERKETILPAVPQWALETCVPRHADPTRPTVRYLKTGDHFHAPFRVLQLDDSRDEAVIQLEDDFTVVLSVKYDDICEYVEIY